MQSQRIIQFLKDVAANNNRPWFQEHRPEYDAVRADFEDGISNAHGKKALRGGYYIHLEPGNCLLACGNYWLPTNILTACRNEIMSDINRWLGIVESRKFINFFGKPGGGEWSDEGAAPKGFGLSVLATAPKGFPRDYEHVEYLKLKDYCCWKRVPDTFFDGDGWLDEMAKVFQVAKPMMDFVNAVIDDYE